MIARTRPNRGQPGTGVKYCQIFDDRGHSKVCARCGVDHGLLRGLIGRQREIMIENCAGCAKKPTSKKAAKGLHLDLAEARRFRSDKRSQLQMRRVR